MRTSHIHLAFIGALLVAVAAFALKGYTPQLKRTKASNAEADRLADTLRASGQVEMDTEQIGGEVERIRARLRAFDTQLPPATEIDKFLAQISEIADRSQMKLDAIMPGEITMKALYAELPITIEGTCRFPHFYRLLREIHSMPRLTKVADLRLTASRDNPTCKIEMTLLIFLARRGV